MHKLLTKRISQGKVSWPNKVQGKTSLLYCFHTLMDRCTCSTDNLNGNSHPTSCVIVELMFKLGKCDQHLMRYFWKGFSLSSTVLAKQDTSGSGCWCSKRSLKFTIILCNSTTVYCKNNILFKLCYFLKKSYLKPYIMYTERVQKKV